MESKFESMEHDNARGKMASHQSVTTPKSVADDYYGVSEMKGEAMDEAYGMAGKSGCEHSMRQVKQQFRDYNWA